MYMHCFLPYSLEIEGLDTINTKYNLCFYVCFRKAITNKALWNPFIKFVLETSNLLLKNYLKQVQMGQ